MNYTKYAFSFCVAACVMLSACVDNTAHQQGTKHVEKKQEKPTVRLSLAPHHPLEVGKPVTVQAKLLNLTTLKAITDDQLQTVHTQKFHLLVIDPTFTDYQHLHPKPTDTPGIYSFAFTPKLSGGYRAWADITTGANSKRHLVSADLGAPRGGAMQKTEALNALVGGYQFALSFDTPPAVGGSSTGSLRVTDKKGNAVSGFEPVMGASAHIVGFFEDFRSIVHTHAMPPESNVIRFHLAPEKSGYVKLFAQLKIGGKEMFVPFGVVVK